MDQQYIDLLTTTNYYLILSKSTGKAYLDKKYNCVMFETEFEAKKYVESVNNTLTTDTLLIQAAKPFKVKELCPMLYAQGAVGIQLFKKGQQAVLIPITKEDAKSGKRGVLFNPEASRFIHRAQETLQKKYLRSLYHCSFYAPVCIDDRSEGQYPHVSYCYATFRSPEQFYVLFTSLEEFELWNATRNNEWAPLEVKINKFDRIRNGNSVIINPLSNKLCLDNKNFNIIKSEGVRSE